MKFKEEKTSNTRFLKVVKRKVSIKKVLLFILICFIFIIVASVLTLLIVYKKNISSVSKDDTNIVFEVGENNTFYSLSDDLYSNNLIRSEFFYKIYLKLNKPTGLKKGVYNLNKSMSVEEIIGVLSGDPDYNYGSISVTFKEGINMRKVASIIEENTNNTYEDVFNLLNDDNYMDELINKYWFLTDEIKNSDVYYPLEGYLFPDTYQIKSDMKVQDIFTIMLDNMELKLRPYKESIKASRFSIHEIITLASMIQSEGNNIEDFRKMASVFITRLDKGMKLQSCATAYYGDKKDMGVDSFGDSYLKNNSYNTYVIPSLPAGPISAPGEDAIDAVLNPSDTNYLYFASDKNMKVYFSSTYSEHEQTVAALKRDGNWYGS